MQLLNVTRWNLELAIFLFIKGPCSTSEFWHKNIKKLVKHWCYFECKGQMLMIRDEKTQMYHSASKSL